MGNCRRHLLKLGWALVLPLVVPQPGWSDPPMGIICESVAEGINGSVEKAFWKAVNTSAGGLECESALVVAGNTGWIEHSFNTSPRGMTFSFRLAVSMVELVGNDAFQFFVLEAPDGRDLVRMRLKRIASGDLRYDIRWEDDNGPGNYTPGGIVPHDGQIVTVEWRRSSGTGTGLVQPNGAVRLLFGDEVGGEVLVLDKQGLTYSQRADSVKFGTVAGVDGGSDGTLEFTPLSYTATF